MPTTPCLFSPVYFEEMPFASVADYVTRHDAASTTPVIHADIECPSLRH